MTHEELGAAIIGFLVIVGLAGLGIVGILKKLGFLKPPCSTDCPDPECKNQLIKTMGKTHDKVLLLEQGQGVCYETPRAEAVKDRITTD